ncbi:hypothetical protein [Lunatibacter salilacus]|uniref:hypothetical protein n=1 Tax=Lunatibacter salilacus TaxID=2483804 RepID=UPI00131D9CEB|nr:hypothetical protein [Lunatibacter salilacus]
MMNSNIFEIEITISKTNDEFLIPDVQGDYFELTDSLIDINGKTVTAIEGCEIVNVNKRIERGFIETNYLVTFILGIANSVLANELHAWLIRLIRQNKDSEYLEISYRGQKIKINRTNIKNDEHFAAMITKILNNE